MAYGERQKDNEQVIRLDDILYIILKHHRTMLGVAVIGLLVGVLISFALYVKGLSKVEYYIVASFAVTTTNENGKYGSNSNDPNATDIHLAEDMTDAVIYVCKSDTTLNQAAERLQLIGVTAEDIKPNLVLTQYESTQIIEMTLVWDNSEEGKMILDAITEVVPDILIDTLKLGDVSIVNPPKVKPMSLSFLNMKVIAICFLAASLAASAFFVLKFFIHPTFLHSKDVVDQFDMEVLGEIPGDKNYFSTKINSFSANEFSSVQEYFSAISHVLIYRLQELDHACVYFTSSAPKEGKTSITANVGYALAELGYKVLLMDMDVRNPSLASKFLFDKNEKQCLNALYRGEVEFEDAIVKINNNLDLLPTRLEDELIKLDMNVVEIISSAKLEYDFVIMDTAPVGQVSDSMSLNQAADCAIYVIRQDQVWINTITESIARLKKSGIPIMGVVMNDTKGGSVSYYHYNYREFGDSPYVNNRKYGSRHSKSRKHDEEKTKEEFSKALTKRRSSLSKKKSENEELSEKEVNEAPEDIKEVIETESEVNTETPAETKQEEEKKEE